MLNAHFSCKSLLFLPIKTSTRGRKTLPIPHAACAHVCLGFVVILLEHSDLTLCDNLSFFDKNYTKVEVM